MSAGQVIEIYKDDQAALPALKDLRHRAADGKKLTFSSSKDGNFEIYIANIDGTGVQQGFITGAGAPCGVAVDQGHIYWANFGKGTVGRANLDGSGADETWISGVPSSCGVAIDTIAPTAGRLDRLKGRLAKSQNALGKSVLGLTIPPMKQFGPMLIVWGKNDFIFPADGAGPYLRDLPEAELHLIDAGHFAVEEQAPLIAGYAKVALRLAPGAANFFPGSRGTALVALSGIPVF